MNLFRTLAVLLPLARGAMAQGSSGGGGLPPDGTTIENNGGSLTAIGVLGTTTNNSAAAGYVGEYQANTILNAATTVTITIASPGMITWTAHGFQALTPIYLSSGGSLPTGFSQFTTYYITAGSVTTNTFTLSASMANALAGTAINTSGTQSETQTGHEAAILASGQSIDIVGLQLNAGDYDCQGLVIPGYGGSTAVTALNTWLSTSGGSSLPNTATAIFPTGATLVSFASIVTPNDTLQTGIVRVSLASAGMAVLSVNNTYTVSSMTELGQIRCRRPR